MQQSVRIGCPAFLFLAGFFLAGFPLMAFSRPALAMDNYPTARLRMLDKVTARTSTFDVRIDTTVRFGPLYIRPRACRKASPLETPESASFLQIWEVTPKQDARWIFSGWMFSSSPALSSMDSPIYDVWVLDCIGDALGGEGGGDMMSGQIGFSSGQIGFTSGQIGFASGGNNAGNSSGAHTQVSFMSGGQISYASGQIRFASTGAAAATGQVGATSSVNFSSSGIKEPGIDGPGLNGSVPVPSGTTPPAGSIAPYDTPAPSPEDDEGQAYPPVPDNRDGGDAGPEQAPRQPAPGDEVAPSTIQEPVY